MVVPTVKKETVSGIPKPELEARSGELMIFCPQCKAIDSVLLDKGILFPTRKFRQIGTRIYHDCGSIKPCRIYRDW